MIDLTAQRHFTDVVIHWLDLEEGYRVVLKDMARDAVLAALPTAEFGDSKNGLPSALGNAIFAKLKESMPPLGGLWGDLLCNAFNSIETEAVAEHYLKTIEVHALVADSGATQMFLSLGEVCEAVNRLFESPKQAETVLQVLKPGSKFKVRNTLYTYLME
jgi:hypothetical protein